MSHHLHAIFLVAAAACAPSTKTASAPAASRECVTGKFVEAVEDDGHGVMVTLSAPRTSASGFQPTSELHYYADDKGNPTRVLKPGDDVWLIRNEPGAIWLWRYLAADEARAVCPHVRS